MLKASRQDWPLSTLMCPESALLLAGVPQRHERCGPVGRAVIRLQARDDGCQQWRPDRLHAPCRRAPTRRRTDRLHTEPGAQGRRARRCNRSLVATARISTSRPSHIRGTRSPRNLASATAMIKNRMTKGGRIHDHVLTCGAWRDSVPHSAIEDEWCPPRPCRSRDSASRRLYGVARRVYNSAWPRQALIL